MNWQPIETAPNDKRILVYSPKCKECFCVTFMFNAEDISDTAWVIARSKDTTLVVRDATHWMPLPQPPESGRV